MPCVVWQLETWALELEVAASQACAVSGLFVPLGLNLLACEVGGQDLLLIRGG